MWSGEEKCLTAGQSTRFLDISRESQKKSAPRGAHQTRNQVITRDELRQKAGEIARGILAVFVLSLSMIVDIDWHWFGL